MFAFIELLDLHTFCNNVGNHSLYLNQVTVHVLLYLHIRFSFHPNNMCWVNDQQSRAFNRSALTRSLSLSLSLSLWSVNVNKLHASFSFLCHWHPTEQTFHWCLFKGMCSTSSRVCAVVHLIHCAFFSYQLAHHSYVTIHTHLVRTLWNEPKPPTLYFPMPQSVHLHKALAAASFVLQNVRGIGEFLWVRVRVYEDSIGPIPDASIGIGPSLSLL